MNITHYNVLSWFAILSSEALFFRQQEAYDRIFTAFVTSTPPLAKKGLKNSGMGNPLPPKHTHTHTFGQCPRVSDFFNGSLPLVLIFLERSLFYLFNAIWLQGLKARFRFRTHCTVILRRLELLTKYSGSEHKKKGLKSLLMIFFTNSCKKKCQILNQCRSLITLCQLGKLVSTWVNLVQFASTWVSLGQLG